ncbi:MAG: hypothetical protein FWG16_03485 [Micrococcales bacterium]|nr:hypothetical protein [Micrococcales bacterium]
MPTNRLLGAIRTRRGLKWGVLAMGIGVLYFIIAAGLTAIVRDGGPGWLNLVVLLSAWNGLKFLWIGPISAVQLVLGQLDRRLRASEVQSQ